MAECLPNTVKALGLLPSSGKKKKKSIQYTQPTKHPNSATQQTTILVVHPHDSGTDWEPGITAAAQHYKRI